MITREQVADLRPGDVVEVSGYPVLKGATVRGPIVASEGRGKRLVVGPVVVRHSDGSPPLQYSDDSEFILTVVSRAPRPLYVNHARSEPVPGDVVTEDTPGGRGLWFFVQFIENSTRWVATSGRTVNRVDLPDRLRLLVDGETGQVVP